ncbi:TPA: hypothetical protein DDZ86_02575 [Candidatus Dependentiae bacterium]|nr:MAG: hypothetical protein UW09_C0001G0133 [candidate division TM6 bacterium GW2011_GWF2_43_87]HBL98504.1 hypothetical protein [Candidatus Dependentiae bacterium]
MINSVVVVHYLAAVVTITFPIAGTAIGQALSSKAAIDALNIQPSVRGSLGKILMVALALTETAALFSTLICFMIVKDMPVTLAHSFGQLGAAFAIAIPACVVGLASSYPIRRAFEAVSRQPLFTQRITYLLFLTLSIAQTPTIFGLMIGMFLLTNAAGAVEMAVGLKLFASGLALGLGSIGPALGVAFFGASTCESVGINRGAYSRIFSFALMSLAIIETPVLFALVISLMLLFRAQAIEGILSISSAISIGLCTVGLGISSGRTASAACLQIARHPDQYSLLSKTSITAQTLIDTNVIYGFLVSIGLLIFF